MKQAIIEALGLLGDARAVPTLIGIMDGSYTTTSGSALGMTGADFYIVRKAAAEALGLIGGSAALATLKRYTDEVEINTRAAARQGVSWLECGVAPGE